MSYTKEQMLALALQGKCGCIPNINCPLHKAASSMYEALRQALPELEAIKAKKKEANLFSYRIKMVKDALAKAEGK